MFGQEGEELNNWRKQNGPIYAEELKKQIEEKNRKKLGSNLPQPTFMDAKPVNKLLPEPERRSLIDFHPRPPILPSSYDPPSQNNQFNYDRIVSYEIPSRIKPCEDNIAILSTKLETMMSSYQENISSLKDRVNQLENTVTSSNQMINSMNDYFKSINNDIQQKVNNSVSNVDSQNNKLNILESKVSKIEEALVVANQKTSLIESQVGESISKLNNSLQQFDAADQSAHSTLFQIIHNLQQKMATAIKDLQNAFQNLQPAVENNILTLEKETKEALAKVRSENNSQIDQIRNEINIQTKETANAFGTFQDDVVQTIQTLSQSINLRTNAILSAINQNSDGKSPQKTPIVIYEPNIRSPAITPQNEKDKEDIQSIIKETVDKLEVKLKDEISAYVISTTNRNNQESPFKSPPISSPRRIGKSLTPNNDQYVSEYEEEEEEEDNTDNPVNADQINGEFKPRPPNEQHYIRVRVKKRRKRKIIRDPNENPPS